MKTKLLLLIFSLYFVEGWTATTGDSTTHVHRRLRIHSTPMQIPEDFPKVPMYVEILTINFNEIESYAEIIITSKITNIVIYSKTYTNVKDIMIDMPLYNKGEYSIKVTLDDSYTLERTFMVQ